MADIIGEATVKITGDISPLQEAAEKAKAVGQQLSNFKIRYDNKEFESFQAYTEEIQKQQEEWEAYSETQSRVADSFADIANEAKKVTRPVEQTTQALATQVQETDRIKISFGEIGQAIEGSFLRAKDAIENTNRIGRTALIGLSAAVTAFAKKSIDEYAKYNESFAKSQEDVEKAVSKVKATIGSMLAPIVNVIGGMADWISQNQQLVAGLFTTVSIIAGSAGIIAVVKKLSTAIAALKVTAGGVIGIIAALAGIVVGMNTETQDYSNTTAELVERQKEQEKQAEDLANAQKNYNKTLADTEQKIADIQAQMEKSEKNYRQNLKKILVDHESTVDELTQQIKNANDEYERAVNERNQTFYLSQIKEEEAHQEKVDELMTQLNFLQRYNNAYNKEKLEAVKFALAREETLYKKRTAAEKAELELQLANDKKKRDEKLAEYQKELNSEINFLKKHRTLLESVRQEILDDEVESLTKQYNEQKASYERQIKEARTKGWETANAYMDSFANGIKNNNAIVSAMNQATNSLPSWARSKGTELGDVFSYTFSGQIVRDIKSGSFWDSLAEGFENLFAGNWAYWSGGPSVRSTGNTWQVFSSKPYYGGGSGRAFGGYTGKGGKFEVADDIYVHRGEYVLPQELVDQTTGTPKLGSNITINLSGTFATSEAEKRKVAQQIVDAIKQTNYARLGA